MASKCKVILSSLLILFSIIAATINCSAQAHFGVEGGVGISNMRFAPDLGFTSASKTAISGGKLGGIIDAKMSEHSYFQTGIFGSLAGHNRNFSFFLSDSVNESVSQNLRLYYIAAPLNVCYKSGREGSRRIIAGIGANIGYLVGGSNKISANGADSGRHFNTSINKTAKPGDPVKGFDMGVNLFGGIELTNGWVFRAYYTTGVSDIGLGTEIDKNRVFGIAAVYMLGKRRVAQPKSDDLIEK